MERSIAGVSCQMAPLFSVPGLIYSACLEKTRSSFALLERGRRSFILISPQSTLSLR